MSELWLRPSSLAFLLAIAGSCLGQSNPGWQGGWPSELTKSVDAYVGFRGRLNLPRESVVKIELIGAHWFNAYLDGQFLTEGPARFPSGHAEYETIERKVKAGVHVLSALVTSEQVTTRMLHAESIPPFFLARVFVNGRETLVQWKCRPMEGYKASGVRVSDQFGWIEWVDTRQIPSDWENASYDDSRWMPPDASPAANWDLAPLQIGDVRHFTVKPTLLAKGMLTGPFEGAEAPRWPREADVSWYKRDLHPLGKPSGVWRRYDLGKVRLGVPEFQLDLPPNAVVEFANSESLSSAPIVDGYTHQVVVEGARDARVVPYIPLSGSLSRNLDHFVSRGGVQTFRPLTPKGGRYLEVQIQADPSQVKFLKESYVERSYFGRPDGCFRCDDPLLNRVWALGIDTLRGCAEDAIIDNPTRERGQWTGDAMVSMQVAAAGYSDLRLFKRGLQQAAYCAQADGLVAGLHPGGEAYLSTYGAQWITAVLNYFDLTGDRAFLEEMYPYAVRDISAFVAHLGKDGIEPFAWAFVDWGFDDHNASLALSLETHEAFESMLRWCSILNQDSSRYTLQHNRLVADLYERLPMTSSTEDWDTLGYQCTALALRLGLIEREEESAVKYMERHLLDGFPNNPKASRLSDPSVHSDQIITPYFAYFAFPPLIEHGQMDFVLDQFRKCWGWALRRGLTTQPEVFDLGWSHCHVWASSPTAQLTKYVLGLTPRFGERANLFELSLAPGSLKKASGLIPLPGRNSSVEVRWRRLSTSAISYEVRSKTPIWIKDTYSRKGVLVSRSHTFFVNRSCTLHLEDLGQGWHVAGAPSEK